MFLYRPADLSTNQEDSTQPSLIVFCTFMGAPLKIVDKYAAGYRKLFPNSSILLILSNLSDTFCFDVLQADRSKKASNTILDVKAAADSASTSPGPFVLHAMSNGGTTAAARIAKHLHDTGHPNTIFSYTIADSAPSHPKLSTGVEAITMQIPIKSPLLRKLGYWALYVTLGLTMFICCDIFRQEDMVRKLRRRWNDAQLFSPQAPRLYLFSKNDALIPYEDVKDHAQDAKQKGWKNVREELFEKAPHCGLILENAGRYWGAIKRLVVGEKD